MRLIQLYWHIAFQINRNYNTLHEAGFYPVFSRVSRFPTNTAIYKICLNTGFLGKKSHAKWLLILKNTKFPHIWPIHRQTWERTFETSVFAFKAQYICLFNLSSPDRYSVRNIGQFVDLSNVWQWSVWAQDSWSQWLKKIKIFIPSDPYLFWHENLNLINLGVLLNWPELKVRSQSNY